MSKQVPTFVDNPDNVTTFPFADFTYPTDSVDLINAVYIIPDLTAPLSPDAATLKSNTPNGSWAGTLCSFKPQSGSRIALVGTAGAFLIGTNTAVNPLFGQATTAGNALFACVESAGAPSATVAAGWSKVGSAVSPANDYVSVWYKATCGAGETAPAFTAVGGSQPMTAQLAEFSGVNSLDRTGSFTDSGFGPFVIAASAIDAGWGNLVVVSFHELGNFFVPPAIPLDFSFNNGAVPLAGGDDGASPGLPAFSRAAHAFALMPATGTGQWYTDETSIALYARREA